MITASDITTLAQAYSLLTDNEMQMNENIICITLYFITVFLIINIILNRTGIFYQIVFFTVDAPLNIIEGFTTQSPSCKCKISYRYDKYQIRVVNKEVHT